MRQLTDLLDDDWGSPRKGTYPSPCQGIENLSYDYSEKSGIDSGAEPRFMVLVHFPNRKYRQITHVQEYDIESMVGNIGGYLGLFLGYSLLHLPQFLISLCYAARKKIAPVTHQRKQISGRSKTQTRNKINESCSCSVKCNSFTLLEGVNKRLSIITQRVEDIESRMHGHQERPKLCVKSVSSNNSFQKVRVTEWCNSVCKPNYKY